MEIVENLPNFDNQFFRVTYELVAEPAEVPVEAGGWFWLYISIAQQRYTIDPFEEYFLHR